MDKKPSSTNLVQKLSLSDFKAETVVFEVRFPACYALWDKSGSLWTRMLDQWPSLKNVDASPAKTTFSLDDKFALAVELEKAFGIGYLSRTNSKDFLETIQSFIDGVTKELRIQNYTRIGFRQAFFREFSTKQEASRALINSGIIHVPKSPQFGIEGEAIFPEYALRWEGKSTGTTVRLRAEERKIELEPALGVTEIETVRVTKYRLALDIDYYASATIAVGQIRVKDWIEQALHLVTRDANSFLEAGR
jgi:hypothetical protein